MRTPVTEANSIMCELEKIYMELTNNSSFEKYFIETWEDETTNGVELASEFNRIMEEEPKKIEGDEPLLCIEISCAYCVQAIKEYAVSNEQVSNVVWAYLTEANFWRYFLKHLILSNQDEKNILSKNASNAAKTRLAKDPKQKDLNEISLKYYEVKDKFKRPGYTAAFVRDMAKQYPNIQSIKTIENLIARLRKEEEQKKT